MLRRPNLSEWQVSADVLPRFQVRDFEGFVLRRVMTNFRQEPQSLWKADRSWIYILEEVSRVGGFFAFWFRPEQLWCQNVPLPHCS